MQVVITGGQGKIAQAIALLLTNNGFNCATPSKQELDVRDEKSVATYFQNNLFEVLVNCAGSITLSNVKDSSTTEWVEDINTNLIGSYLCCKSALRQNCKKIINIGSSAGFKGKANWSAYCAAKAGLASLTQSLAEEGILAYTVSPGRTKSKMREKLFPNENQETLLNSEDVAQVVLDVLHGKYLPGDNISIKKNPKKMSNEIKVYRIDGSIDIKEEPKNEQKSAHKVIKINTEKQFTNITPKVAEFVEELGTGMVHIFSRHTTLSVRVFEAEILLLADVCHFLEKLAPKDSNYNHDNIWIRDVPINERINGYSHIRSLFFNTVECVPVDKGKLMLGKWQSIFAIELDPIHEREIVLTFIKA